MTQIFKVTVDGTIVTEYVSGCSITESMQRFYNVATFKTSLTVAPKSLITIEYGDRVFTGFVYSLTKASWRLYSVECRTLSAYLTTPFVADDTIEIIPAKTSHDLCSYYQAKYGIPIGITAINLDFGGDFEQKGTPLKALTTIANVTGADYWFDGMSIRIEPAKWIEANGEEIPPADIFNFVPFQKTIEQKGIGTVIVGNKAKTTSKTASISCTAKVDGCNSLAMIRVIPHDAYEYATGLHNIQEVQTPIHHKGILSMSSYLSLEADIVSISSVSIDGVLVSDFTFVNNTIIFSSAKRGMAVVDYVGWGISGYVDTKWIEKEKIGSFSVYYNKCDVYNFDGVLTCSKTTQRDVGNNCGGTIVMAPKEMNYVKGFTFSTFGGVPYIYFSDESKKIWMNVTSTPKNIARLEPGMLSVSGSGLFQHKLRFTKVAILSVQSRGTTIPYSDSGDYVYFDKFYPGVTISYTASGIEHTVQHANIPDKDISMIVSGPEEGEACSYPLEGSNYSDGSTLSCSLGSSLDVNIADIHGISLDAVRGRTAHVTEPNGTSDTYTADDNGVITIVDMKNGTYNIDTSTMWPNSYIKFISGAI